jgi:RNA recognition motif-containing protein
LNELVGWQDLKDLFRQAGDVARADVHYDAAGQPKGSGIVAFTSAADAQTAICAFSCCCRRPTRNLTKTSTGAMFNGVEINGMTLEVREDKFAQPAFGAFGRGGGGPTSTFGLGIGRKLRAPRMGGAV